MAQNALLAKTRTDEIAVIDGVSREATDIERATALLRQQHPDLEIWHGEPDFGRKKLASPAWIAIGVVWVATLLLIGLAVAGLVFLWG